VIPRRVELTNFLSFGEGPEDSSGRRVPGAVIEFTDDEPLWVLCGANGVGKSAVFDAMTFSLFGHHRAGVQDADLLIRHGANSFRVAFEFEFNTAVYAVERGRDRRAPVQRVRQLVGGAWEDIDLSSFRERDRIRAWAELTLGIRFEAFCASVLLRQGQADQIITAAPRDRLMLLRCVIGAERYARLYDRVQSATRNLGARRDAAATERDRTQEVSAAQLEDAAGTLQRVTDELNAARGAVSLAVVSVEQARHWNDLEREREQIEVRLREADTRAAEAERIRADHTRFEDLGRVLPVLGELIGLRVQLVQLEATIAGVGRELTNAISARDAAGQQADAGRQRATESRQCAETNTRDAERLREQITRTRHLLTLADEIAGLITQFARFPEDLDTRHTTVAEQVRQFTDAQRTAGERRAAAAGLLRAAEARRREFDLVEIGAECSRCGQPVLEEHARREKTELDDDIARHRDERDQAQTAEAEAHLALSTSIIERDRLSREIRDRDRLRDRLDLQRQNLQGQGGTADAVELRVCIVELGRRAEAHEQAATTAAAEQQDAEATAIRREAERQHSASRATALEAQRTTATNDSTRATTRCDTLLEQLPPNWRDRFPTLNRDDWEREQKDLDLLRRSDIAGQFRQLADDAARREAWADRLSQIADAIEQLPAGAQCAVADAERAARDAHHRLTTAEAEHTATRDFEAQLRRDAQRRQELSARYQQLDRDHRVHSRLAELLGPQQLQRYLVRTAEREIVRYANDTVRNLSHGDLTIELEVEDGGDGALALNVRRADDPTPIPAPFLSGSQKFRVAVAVALAIGRFASGQARPLESVIIDEGFGSLDRDGLRAMASELRNLQQAQALRRLILVSHQEEFTAGFPVGYYLERSEGGTTATRFRREVGAPA
jgi:DNA repair exonuclease SbcCD ATPase subunit